MWSGDGEQGSVGDTQEPITRRRGTGERVEKDL
jgi:hypothetical protein